MCKNMVAVGEWGIEFAVAIPHKLVKRLPHSWNTFEMSVDKEVVAVDFEQ